MAAPQRSAVRRAGQVLTGLGAFVLLGAVLAGGPIALLAFAGNPLPDHLPTLAEVGTALTSRDDGQLFLRALAVVGWFGWATFAFSVLVELLAAALRRPAPRLPGMRRQQRAAAALVGSVALILAASPAAASAATLTAPHPVAAPAVVAANPTVVSAGPGIVRASPAAASAGPTVVSGGTAALGPNPALASAAPAPAGEPAVYRVAKGDYLGEVAERYLDDFDRYREVARLNRLADPDRIHPGQLLRLPDGAVDDGVRRHATGHLVARPAPAPRPPAGTPHGPGSPGPHGPGVGSAGPHSPGAGQPGPGTATPGSPAAPGGGSGATTAPGGATATTAPGGAATAGGGAGANGPAVPAPAGSGPTRAGSPGSVVAEPAGPPPAMGAGASRATVENGMNRPLAISAVLAVASIVGAQIGAVLGLRRRPAPGTAGRTLTIGRHRKD